MATPIDFVVPMVFPNDPQWRNVYFRYHNVAPERNVRWRSWGTEELMVRCVLRYMPWVNCIHVLLASESQVQPWMQGFGSQVPKLIIHYHREFIPREYLPCFASPCIEMFLDRIPGLSDYFIYANDDMFPLSTLSPDDFFREGKACQHFMELPWPEQPNMFQRKCRYQLEMIAGEFGGCKTYLKSLHSFAPILMSSCREVWRRHGSEILRYLSPIGRNDHTHNHYIYMLYQHFAGMAVDHVPPQEYIGKDLSNSLVASICRKPDAGIVCFNDNENIDDWEQRASIVRREISAKLT